MIPYPIMIPSHNMSSYCVELKANCKKAEFLSEFDPSTLTNYVAKNTVEVTNHTTHFTSLYFPSPLENDLIKFGLISRYIEWKKKDLERECSADHNSSRINLTRQATTNRSFRYRPDVERSPGELYGCLNFCKIISLRHDTLSYNLPGLQAGESSKSGGNSKSKPVSNPRSNSPDKYIDDDDFMTEKYLSGIKSNSKIGRSSENNLAGLGSGSQSKSGGNSKSNLVSDSKSYASTESMDEECHQFSSILSVS